MCTQQRNFTCTMCTTKKFYIHSVHNKRYFTCTVYTTKKFYMYSVHNKEILHVLCTQQRNFACRVYTTKKFYMYIDKNQKESVINLIDQNA